MIKTTYEIRDATKAHIEEMRDELRRRGFYGATASVIADLILSSCTIEQYIELYKPVIAEYARQINEKGSYETKYGYFDGKIPIDDDGRDETVGSPTAEGILAEEDEHNGVMHVLLDPKSAEDAE